VDDDDDIALSPTQSQTQVITQGFCTSNQPETNKNAFILCLISSCHCFLSAFHVFERKSLLDSFCIVHSCLPACSLAQ
jgi:hypothetical protein